jgi:hypothetical protein
MVPRELKSHVFVTYTSLRTGLGIIALAFPLILLFAGWAKPVPDHSSFCSYYHSYMRDFFVGGLFALGSFMYLYKGFSWQENYALNVAGILAILIAVVPTDLKSAPPIAESLRSQVHTMFSIAFLLTIGYVCVFRSADTLPLLRPGSRANVYYYSYKLLGLCMVATPLAVYSYAHWKQRSVPRDQRIVTFYVEVAAVWAFGFYWLLKTKEIADSLADRTAVLRVQAEGSGARTAASPDVPPRFWEPDDGGRKGPVVRRGRA